MAVLTAQGISTLAIQLLARQLVLPRTVAMVPGRDYAGPNGATVTVRVPQPRASKTQSAPGDAITITSIDETGVDVTLAHLYDAVNVTDEDLSLGIEDFGRQVLAPMLASVAAGAENQVATVFNGVTADITEITETSIEDNVLQAREMLSLADVPTGDRFLACAPDVATFLLKLDNLSDVAAAGSPSALRDAVIGRYRGFTVVESNGLTAGTAVAYHRSGLAWGNRSPVLPGGGVDAAAVSEQGVALRTVRDFDVSHLQDAVAVSTFAGANTVDLDRLVKLTTATA